jgi:polygalacturonase
MPSPDLWKLVPGIIARIRLPAIPPRTFEAELPAAETTDARPGLQAVIDACAHAGGGRVVVRGVHLIDGPLVLRSRVNLHLAAGAVLRFGRNPESYLPPVFQRWAGTECYSFSPLIYIRDAEDVAVTGEGGLIDGQGDAWWHWKKDIADNNPEIQRLRDMGENGVPVEQRVFGLEGLLRPPLFAAIGCRRLLIEGVHFLNSPFWTVVPTYCEEVTVRDCTIEGHGPNTDGCNPDSCRFVLIERVRFETHDDCVAIKSGYNRDGRRVNRPSEDIVVRDCRFTLGHGVSVGSEMSGDVRRVFFERCAGDKLPLSFAINIRSCPGRGGTIEGIRMRDCTYRAIALNAVAVELVYSYNGPNAAGALPTLRDIVIERVTCEGVGEQALAFIGRTDTPIRDLCLRDVSIRAAKPASIRNVVGLTMENCSITNIRPDEAEGLRPVQPGTPRIAVD